MGTKYKGVNATAALQSPPSVFEYIEEGQQYAYRQYIYDSFTLTADLASGDTVLMGGLIPTGAMLQTAEFTCGALGGSCTLNIGWQAGASGAEAAQSTGLFSAVAASAAVQSNLATSTATVTYVGHVFSEPVQLVIAENAVSSGATGKIIQLAVGFIQT